MIIGELSLSYKNTIRVNFPFEDKKLHLELTSRRFANFNLNKCDMIEGNETLVKNINSYFLTQLSHNFKILHFEVMKNLSMLKTIYSKGI